MNKSFIKLVVWIGIALSAFAITVFFIIHIFRTTRLNPVVKTKLGYIKGVRAQDGDYTMYLGIPYAKVNESNPFGNAVPIIDLGRVFTANNNSAICPQRTEDNTSIVGTLDCLHLNINVPNSASVANRLPTLVYIYGNKYDVSTAGRNFYGPKFLMKQNIIFITLNYRVGPYGFLCLDTPEVPSNQGLKDQVLALKWIKENIAAFGGDSSKVTLAGEGTGGTNVDFHLTFDKEPLFTNAIIKGGIYPESLTVVPSDNAIALKLAADLGLKTNGTIEALKFLASQDTEAVIAASNRLNISYGLCIEKQLEGVERLITNYTTFVDVPNLKDVSVLVSQTDNEIVYRLADKYVNESDYNNTFKEILLAIFDVEDEQINSLVELVRQFYIGEENVHITIKQPVTELLSDILVNYPIRKKIKYFIKNGAKRIYHSIFSYTSDRNVMKDVDNNKEGALHADEIEYLFDVPHLKNSVTPKDQVMIDRITTLWGNFVKNGNPTPERTSLLPIIWEPVTERSLLYLNLDLDLSMGIKPFNERMLFWDQFYKENNVTLRSSIPWTI